MVIVKYLMRIIPAVLLVFCFSQASNAAQTPGSAGTASGGDKDVIALVNGHSISGLDLETVIRRELASIGNPEWDSLRADYRATLIYDGVLALVNSHLLYEKAVASGAKATDEEVEAQVQIASKSFSSDADMNIALARLFLDRDSWRRNLSVDITVMKFLTSLAEVATVEPEEISKYYEGNTEEFSHPDIVRASHIMLASAEKPDLDDAVKEKAEGLLARAKNGEDFAKLAREHSVDGTASNGGDLGYVTKDSIDPVFADAVFSMSQGEIRLIKTSFGHHVIKLTEKKPAGVAPLDDVRDYIATTIRSEKADKELISLMQKLQNDADIKILISAEDWNPRGSSPGKPK